MRTVKRHHFINKAKRDMQKSRGDSEVKQKSRISYSRKAKRRRQKREINKMSTTKLAPQPFGDASLCGWYWQNYYNALNWSERHQIAYWRSRSVALEYENVLLHQYVQTILDRERPETWNDKPSVSRATRKRYNRPIFKPPRQQEVVELESEESEDEFVFQVSEEMKQFFEISIRHKMEREKQKKKEKQCSAEDEESDASPPDKQVGLERIEDMHRIYGKAAPMIIGMETAMQLTFDRNCDIHQPKPWPNIPLNF